MIPLFPEFKPLDPIDRPYFDELFARLTPLCSEYTFTNLFGWRGALWRRLPHPSREGRRPVVCAAARPRRAHGAPPVIHRVGEEFAAHPSFDRDAFLL